MNPNQADSCQATDSHFPVQTHIPTLKAEYQALFPSCDTLDEVVAYAQSKLPLNQQDSHVLFTLLMLYHNTLLKLAKPQ